MKTSGIIFAIALLFAGQSQAQPLSADLEVCRYSCNSRCEQTLVNMQRQIDRIASACDFGGGSAPQPAQIGLFKSDTCNSELISFIGPSTDCSKLSSYSNDAWGIKVGGKCINIQDTSPQTACKQFKEIRRSSVLIFKSDSCSSDMLAAVNSYTDCATLSSYSNDAWGISIDGTCNNIQDMSPRQACEQFKSAGGF